MVYPLRFPSSEDTLFCDTGSETAACQKANWLTTLHKGKWE